MGKSKLHPGVKWSWRVRSYIFYFILMIFISAYIAPFFLITLKFNLLKTIGILFLIYVFLIVIREVFIRLGYNRWFYEFTPTNLKIEYGVIWKTYKNIPYGRVQNVDIRRGVIARMLGFSSVMIQTAGYSGGGRGVGVEGHIPAVEVKHAEEIRDFVIKKISHKKSSSGL